MVASPQGVSASLARSIRVTRVDDRAIWDAAIDRLNGSVLQSWRWGEFKSLHGWNPVRFLVSEGDEPICAASILTRAVGPMTVLYIPRGPVMHEPRPDAMSALTVAIDNLAREERAVVCFCEPENDRIALPQSGTLGWERSSIELQPLRTIKVRIHGDDESILEGMKSKTRYNVRLAGRRGVTVREASIKEVAAFYEILEETSERDTFGIHSVEYYADMLDAFGNDAALLVAELDGEIAAGAIVLKHGDEAIYMFGASTRKHQRHMPTHLLQFEAMRWARERGCSRYDLWGIPPTDEPPEEADGNDLNVRSGLWGVYRFKQGFGGEIVSYPGVYERQYYPRLISLWRKFRPGPGA